MFVRRLLKSLPLVAAVLGAAVYTTACCCCGPSTPTSGINEIHDAQVNPPTWVKAGAQAN